MHPFPFPRDVGKVKPANNFRNFLKAAMLKREFKLGIQSLISVYCINVK